jgi:two-component system, NarL family, sensor kinase
MDTKEATLFTAIVIAGFIIIFFISFFILSIIRQQRRILELSRQNSLAEITAMEKERARIANDLHDDLGPIMSVTKFQVDNLTIQDEEEKEQQHLAVEHLDNLLTRLREISNDLMPQVLLRKGLWASLEEFILRIKRNSGISISLSLSNPPLLPQDIEINIYRVLQEIFHNILKHAIASEVNVEVVGKEKQLIITCMDNGKGFDYEKTLRENAGQGLQSIQNRVQLLKGQLVVQSRAGKGTAYQITVPVI